MFEFTAGSISHGTLRLQDLVPAYATLLGVWLEHQEVNLRGVVQATDTESMKVIDYLDLFSTVKHRLALVKDDDPYWTDGSADMDLEELCDVLNDLAPGDHYFGAHEGDGSDFGFWPIPFEDR